MTNEIICKNGLSLRFFDTTVKIQQPLGKAPLLQTLWYERLERVSLPSDESNRLMLLFRKKNGREDTETLSFDTYQQVRAAFQIFDHKLQQYPVKRFRRHATFREIWQAPLNLILFIGLGELILHGIYLTARFLYQNSQLPIFLRIFHYPFQSNPLVPFFLGLALALLVFFWGLSRQQKMRFEMDVIERE